MPAYMIAICEITNPGPGLKEYSEKSAKISASYGGKYLVKSPNKDVREGDALQGKVTIIAEFPSMEKLQAFYTSPEYQEAKQHRAGTGTYEIAFYEGVTPE